MTNTKKLPGPGRPRLADQPLKKMNLLLEDHHIAWLRAHPGKASEIVRRLIDQAMKEDK